MAGRPTRKVTLSWPGSLTREQMAAVLRQEQGSELMRAIEQLIGERLVALCDAARDPKLSDGEAKYWLGGQEALLALRYSMQNPA